MITRTLLRRGIGLESVRVGLGLGLGLRRVPCDLANVRVGGGVRA